MEAASSLPTSTKYRRRSSLFQAANAEGEHTGALTPTDFDHNYPNEYIQKLKIELNSWDKAYDECHLSIIEKKKHLKAKRFYDSELLNQEQLDFLSNTTDYDKYLQCILDFNNRFKIAIEERKRLKEQISYTKDSLEIMEGRILELNNKYF